MIFTSIPRWLPHFHCGSRREEGGSVRLWTLFQLQRLAAELQRILLARHGGKIYQGNIFNLCKTKQLVGI